MSKPVLFHDPTSEPSRAVHWLTIEADIQVELEYTWLTRGEHRKPEFLSVNPGHQVPALRHEVFCLAEATAIILYLVELNGIQDQWVGATADDRACTHRFLSWHHTNTRLKLTLDYFLPVLLIPAYHGVAPPRSEEVKRLRNRGRESLELLELLLGGRGAYLGGRAPTVADLFIASDLFALDLDPDRDAWFDGFPAVSVWLESLRSSHGYQVSHRPWNAIIPRLQELLSAHEGTPRDNFWVADACAPYLKGSQPDSEKHA